MRAFLRMLPVAMWALGACGEDAQTPGTSAGKERLAARPVATTVTSAAGSYSLLVTATKDARLIIPQVAANRTVPLLVMLHGAGGDEAPVEVVADEAAQRSVAVLIPKSRLATWDLAMGGFGDDVEIGRAHV